MPLPPSPTYGIRAASSEPGVLVVIRGGQFTTHPLPERGDVTIGRSHENDIAIDDPAISRRHVVLHLGEDVLVEDVGSAHGTTVCRTIVERRLRSERATTAEIALQRIAPNVPLAIGPDAVIKLGSTALVLKRGAAGAVRILAHELFITSLEEECARAGRSRSRFGVALFHVGARVPRARVADAFGQATRQGDVVAARGADTYELLLVDADPPTVRLIASRIQAALGGGGELRVGLAHHPDDGRSGAALLARATRELEGRREQPGEGPCDDDAPAVIVCDPQMARLHALVERIADSDIVVLLLGGTGVGKEILADALHRRSQRAARPFLKLNCASFSETLLESELFGHERGAFTGAVQAKEGLLESADGGTVFLDEVGELPLSTQGKLLRVLESKQVQRIGALRSRRVDVRFVAATNRELESDAARGAFRQDLFFRLSGIPLVIPPLRERPLEIVPLAMAFLARAARIARRSRVPDIAEDVLESLRAYAWPGNVRELRNVVERALLLCGDGPITLEHAPAERMHAPRAPSSSSPASSPASAPSPSMHVTVPPAPSSSDVSAGLGEGPLRDGVEQAERTIIARALERCGGNQTKAARVLGVSRRTLVARLVQYALPRPRKQGV